MKLNINTSIIKKGLYYSSLALMCFTTSGCTKESKVEDENNNDNTYINVYELNNIENQELSVVLDNDTKETLNKYNEFLGNKKMSVDDLEVLSMYNVPMFVIRNEEGNYSQIGDNYYVATRENGDIDILFSKIPGEAEYDMLTGNKLEKNVVYTDYIPVIEYISSHNIEFVGYKLPTHVAYSELDINTIESIYGQDVVECVKELGIPLKVYDAKDFQPNNDKVVTKIKK